MGIPTLINGAFGIAQVAAEDAADQRALALKSREHERSMRATKLQEMDAYERGALEASRARMAGSEVVGAQRVAFASSGIDVNSGTAAQLQRASEAMAELDASTARNNARREAFGFKQAQRQLIDQAQAEQDGYRNRSAERPMRWARSLLGGQ